MGVFTSGSDRRLSITSLLFFIVLHSLLVLAMLQWVARSLMPVSYFFGTSVEAGAVGHEDGRWLRAWRLVATPAAANRLNYGQLCTLSLLHLASAAVTYLAVTYVTVAPFGRYAAQTRVPIAIPNTLSWMLQEAPTVWNVLFFVLYEYPSAYQQYHTRSAAGGTDAQPYVHLVMEALALLRLPLLLFLFHYIHRSFIFPLFLGRSRNDTPLHVTLSATAYCLFNGRLQLLASITLYPVPHDAGGGASLVEFFFNRGAQSSLCLVWLLALVALGGSYCFFRGMYINMMSDYMLIDLRRQRQRPLARDHQTAEVRALKQNYAIPYGFYFEHVSCPNFYGELVEWLGYAVTVLATGVVRPHPSAAFGALGFGRAAAAFSFFVYTAANLVPRAVCHHAWYIHTFGDAYRALHRRAIFPWYRAAYREDRHE
ncbi:3-oxo-5-alpha-steroid 4-dehydrogenase 1 [Strigomonas culicis]|uniref:3-oxo-5-alpha-steroid 4-dehydrogenase 1 n=1 Tax=Strigomonas culicis TaxID=28005 RepID=S9UPC8_9TRYP|nr:3-oxo-5-alpha-steroid 4-dehydrogenase 1 [Strigomonas culicis]|eukprot:EPY32742.1 3-oxo-5-alpha-steroid 4-dehydrogenase 1 [Strigomonas culicis]